MPVQVFISYSHADKDYARHLEDLLKHSGITVFESRQISPGEDWASAIQELLDECSAVIALVSNNWLQSPYIAFEMGAAVSKEKRIIPVTRDLSQIPPILHKYAAVDANKEDSKIVSEIIKAIK